MKNVSLVTLEAEARKRVAETCAQGESEAVRIFQELQNELLFQKAQLVAQAGDLARITLFVQQHLEKLFEAYQQHAKGLAVDNLVIMDEERGFNGAVNRGPEALVDFLRHFEKGFGISVRELMGISSTPSGKEEKII